MGLIFCSLNQVLCIIITLQCYHARLEYPEHEMGYVDNSFVRPNDAEATDISLSSLNEEAKNIHEDDLKSEDTKMVGNKGMDLHSHSNSGIRKENSLYHNGHSGKQRSKQERTHSRFDTKLESFNERDDQVESLFEDGLSGHDLETGRFYLTKPSDVANMSAMLGPGPIPLRLSDQTTKEPSLHPVVGENNTNIAIHELDNVANVSLEQDNLVSFVDGPKRARKNKLKLRNDFRKTNEAMTNWNNMLMPIRKSKKSRIFQNHGHIAGQKKTNVKEGIKTTERKYKTIQNKSPSEGRRNGNQPFHNAKEQFANLSVINKSLQNAASKKFDLNNKHVSVFNGEGSAVEKEPIKKVVDKISDEDAKKLCLLNVEREISEEQQTSLRDETAEVETKNGNGNYRKAPNKGIRTKIEHEDWLDHVTLLPVTDYNVRKHKAYKKQGLHGSKNYINEVSPIHRDNTDNRKTKVGSSGEKKKGNKFKNFVSGVLLANHGNKNGKRDERDINSRVIRHDSQSPIARSIFSRHMDTDDLVEGEMNDMDTKNNEKGFFKNNDENEDASSIIGEKNEDYYQYDSNLSEGDKSATEFCIANKTVVTTQTKATLSSTDTTLPTQPTRIPNNHKTTLQTNDKHGKETLDTTYNRFGQRNNTMDSHEMFLSGQLADRFVSEVLKKVKSARKVARELGYSNETDETCDRCVELKETILPNMTVMRNSLERCSRNITNGPKCCAVPRPMQKYLDILVSFEKENENNFYNKIQDDSSFIFTGDYPESPLKEGSNTKIEDKYMEEGSIIKDAIDGQHLREDENEEKTDKMAGSNLNVKEKNHNEVNSGKTPNTKENESHEGAEKEGKGYMRRFGKSKINLNQDGLLSDIGKQAKQSDVLAGLNEWTFDPLAKEHIYNAGTDDVSYYPNREIRKSWTDIDGQTKYPPYSSQNHHRNIIPFDRYGKRNYDYSKYPEKVKISQNIPRYGYKGNNYDSMKYPFPNNSPNENELYRLPITNDLSSSKDESQVKDTNFIYHSNKYGGNKVTGLKEKHNGYQSNSDLLYNNNEEYSLYPNLDGQTSGEATDGMTGKFKMVKRDAENPAEYDEEPSVLFEVPIEEYDLTDAN